MMDCCKPGCEHRVWLGPEFERDASFWDSFVSDAEHLLEDAGIESHGGTANGDLPLGCYASLRNEAFVLGTEKMPDGTKGQPAFIYPPNETGWNAAGHVPPMHVPVHRRCQAAATRALHLASLIRFSRQRQQD
jgi:hypothetical protein